MTKHIMQISRVSFPLQNNSSTVKLKCRILICFWLSGFVCVVLVCMQRLDDKNTQKKKKKKAFFLIVQVFGWYFRNMLQSRQKISCKGMGEVGESVFVSHVTKHPGLLHWWSGRRLKEKHMICEIYEIFTATDQFQTAGWGWGICTCVPRRKTSRFVM